jgi:hypothetical protein
LFTKRGFYGCDSAMSRKAMAGVRMYIRPPS